ncbi:MAG: hypothetical protein NZ959_08165 [Armatimonadetes bacterium]|nr:hypothetical protein [Armatimonadota bacterium]MDW8122805.1 hypothetical protein [Armatimonadota bacterium]
MTREVPMWVAVIACLIVILIAVGVYVLRERSAEPPAGPPGIPGQPVTARPPGR